ncbi:hypothetical protein [Siminovitchia fordii]|uniref:Homing endonuclease LAGLIDADG domain-containing protein n=1 Tax=Siminovitchia fordii TaxID=254759 RepID=A0ABQ4K598_9BACI|nr:hypothetical protein [Siminovitchia fordii]GIN20370.1 hypothetical protein J1TS3_15040 [Siminovitchia fordii]
MEFDNFFLAYLVDPTGIGFGLMQKNKVKVAGKSFPCKLLD